MPPPETQRNVADESVCAKSTIMPFGKQIFLFILDELWAPGQRNYCRCASGSHQPIVLSSSSSGRLKKADHCQKEQEARNSTFCWDCVCLCTRGASVRHTCGVLREVRRMQNRSLHARTPYNTTGLEGDTWMMVFSQPTVTWNLTTSWEEEQDRYCWLLFSLKELRTQMV